MALPIVINEIRRLNQEEGYFDHEIAKSLGLSRGAVTRLRHGNEIPKVNLRVRKDKLCVCTGCKTEFVIRRCQWKKKYCPDCQARQDGIARLRRKIAESRREATKRAEKIKKLRYIEYNY